MYPERIFKEIETLLPKVEQYNKTKSVYLSLDEKLLIQKLYKELLPMSNPSLACDSCVIHYMNTLLSFHEREFPKFLKENQPKVEEKVVVKTERKTKLKKQNN